MEYGIMVQISNLMYCRKEVLLLSGGNWQKLFHTNQICWAIGIGSNLDWKRIAKLFRIGLFAGIMAMLHDLALCTGQGHEGHGGRPFEKAPSSLR